MSTQINYVERKTHPAFFDALKRMGCTYRKHRATVVVTDKATLTAPYWSDGSKEAHFALRKDGRCEGVYIPTAGWPAPPASATFDTREITYVTGGTFMGKSATWTLYIHPENLKHFGLDN